MENEKNSSVREAGLDPKSKKAYKDEETMEDREESKAEEQKESGIIPEVPEENSETQIIDVQFDLTDEELLQVGEKIGELDAEEDTLVAEKKAAVSMWSAKLNGCKAEKSALCKMLKAKTETRTVECHVDPDFEAGLMCYVSVETGAVVFERKLTSSERQLKLFEE